MFAWKYQCMLQLARIITDSAVSDKIQPVHLAEALQYQLKLMVG